jgi:hypothetical protein
VASLRIVGSRRPVRFRSASPQWLCVRGDDQPDTPQRRSVLLSDLELLVRVPGRPETVRAFTRAEAAEADEYAGRFEGAATIEPLR